MDDQIDGWDDDPEDEIEDKKSDKLPEIYRIPGESNEVGSWDELVERAPHISDLEGLPGKLQVREGEEGPWIDAGEYLRPDEIGDRKLDILSGLDKLIMHVTNKVQNAFIYTRLRTDSSRFQAEFVAIAVVAGKTYTATYLTPGYAIGMTDKQVAREGDIVLGGLIANLGQRVFGQPTPHIPDGAFMSFEYTEKW